MSQVSEKTFYRLVKASATLLVSAVVYIAVNALHQDPIGQLSQLETMTPTSSSLIEKDSNLNSQGIQDKFKSLGTSVQPIVSINRTYTTINQILSKMYKE